MRSRASAVSHGQIQTDSPSHRNQLNEAKRLRNPSSRTPVVPELRSQELLSLEQDIFRYLQ